MTTIVLTVFIVAAMFTGIAIGCLIGYYLIK